MTAVTPERPSRTDPPIGALLVDRYRLDALIGTGGMATVYRATDESLGRTVAIKVFRSDVADASDVRRRSSEVRLVASLSHPGVVTLFDAVADDATDQAFLVLQHIDGTDLRTKLGEGALDAATTAAIATDLAEALAYVHDRGVIHRDLKPANILLREDSGRTVAILTDFGIAQLLDGDRLTATGSVLGTAAFLSPEQALGKPLTPATDIYSLGLVLIECLTGERVFPGSGLETAVARLSSDPFVPQSVGSSWQALLIAMTAREPEDRPTAAEVAASLRAMPLDESIEPTLRLPAASEAATERFAAAAVAAVPESVETGAGVATQRMAPPAPAARTTSTTATRPSVFGAASRTSKPRKAGLAVLVGLLLTAVVALAIWGVSTALAPEPATSIADYPAVEGDLGVALGQLQVAVTVDEPGDTVVSLQEAVLGVTEASNAGDWMMALTGLGETSARLDDALAAGELDGALAEGITAAIDGVRTQLEALLAPPPEEDNGNEGNGNGNEGNGNGGKEGKDDEKGGKKDD